MVVDAPDDIVVQPSQNEKDEVAIINPDQLDNDADHENITLANDCMYLYMAIWWCQISLFVLTSTLGVSRCHEGDRIATSG